MYPSIKMKSRLSCGSSVISSRKEPHGCQRRQRNCRKCVSNGLWCGRGAVCTKKALACGIKSVTRSIYSIDGIVIAAFTVFGFVINAGAAVALYDFDFTGAVIFLKIIHIFNGIPQTEFNIRIKTDVFLLSERFFRLILFNSQSAPIWERVRLHSFQFIFNTFVNRISKTVAAFISIQCGL